MNVELLRRWFLTEQRELPWRQDRTPYSVWVSEMMLQQTQASVVIPYYYRWMERFPDISSLASASLDEVIKMWEGLGYYSRARYLHAGARYLQENCGGIFPNDPQVWENIKGLGPYTKGAIQSFAFHQKVPSVDGNVIRVLSRYYAFKEDISKPKSLQHLQRLAADLLPNRAPWEINEALIELGATVCTKQPKCSQCPLRKNCLGQNNFQDFPYKSKTVKREVLHRSVAILQHGDRFLILRVEGNKIMSDLHEFPYFEEKKSVDTLAKSINERFGVSVKWKKSYECVQHSFTRFFVHLFPEHFLVKKAADLPGHQWLTLDEMKERAFSSGHRRLLHLLSS